jgi:hypothetical protein
MIYLIIKDFYNHILIIYMFIIREPISFIYGLLMLKLQKYHSNHSTKPDEHEKNRI